MALARPHLVNPHFTLHAAAEYGVEEVDCPPQYLAGRDQAMRNAPRARQELMELKLKAKPRHKYQSERGRVAAE